MFNNVYNGKTVLVTGHTGFKGSWLSIWLNMMGAKVVGYSLDHTRNAATLKPVTCTTACWPISAAIPAIMKS